MRSYNRQGASHNNGLRIGLKVGGSIENGGLVEYFFGKDGKGCLQLDKFVQFLRDLHDEVPQFFSHWFKNTIIDTFVVIFPVESSYTFSFQKLICSFLNFFCQLFIVLLRNHLISYFSMHNIWMIQFLQLMSLVE